MKNLLLSMIALLGLCTSAFAQNNALKIGRNSPQDYVQINYDTALNLGTGPFTFEALVKVSNVGQAQTIASNRTFTLPASGFWIYINSNGRLGFTLGTTSVTSTGPDIRDSVCHHIALSRDASSIVSVYVDGTLQSSYQVTSSLTNPLGHGIWLGRDDFDPSVSHFKGMMDEIRIWRIARSASEINTNKNTSINPNTTGLYGYYQCNQGIASGNNSSIYNLQNASSVNYNGTLINFILAGDTSNFVTGCSFSSGCVAFAGNDTTICTTNTLVLNPTPPGGTYTDNGNPFSGLLFTGTSPSVHTLIYTAPSGCKDTMQIIVRLKPNLGADRSICKNDSIVFPAPNAAYQVAYTVNGNAMTNVFNANSVGTFTISANASGCRDTVVITVKDTCVSCFALAGNDTTICTTNTLVLNPTPPGGTYTDNGNPFSGTIFTGVSPSVHILIYTAPSGCKDTMQIIVRLKPNLGADRSICKNDSIVFPAPNAAYQVAYTVNGNSMTNVFYANTVGTFTIAANASGCRDTVVITVKDTCKPPANICQYFTAIVLDTNCCSAGLSRIYPGGPNVTSISYLVSGGVIQNYTTNCSGSSPVSYLVNGSSTGNITFNPSCNNLQFFNTSLQSTNATGNMVVLYTVKFANGDSCRYSVKVEGCDRAPQTQCDKFKIQNLKTGSFLIFNYLNIKITNNIAPASPICNVIFTKYSASNTVEPNYFLFGVRTNAPTQVYPSPVSNVSVFPAVAINSGNVLNYQLVYSGSVNFTGYIEVKVIHCSGDTCKYKWSPKTFNPSDAVYLDYTFKKVVNPYAKMYAYSLKLIGPSQIPSGDNPYKVSYVSIVIPDTGNAEIAACTGASNLYDADAKINRLKTNLSEHSRKYALFELAEPLEVQPRDSSGLLQLIFGNSLPNNIYYNLYDEEGNTLNSGNLLVDTTTTGGITRLGKSSQGLDEPILFNIYPNPSNGLISCKLSNPKSDDIILHILNLEGKEIFKQEMGLKHVGLIDLTVDLSQLPDGNYFVNTECKNSGKISNSLKLLLIK